MKTISPWKMSLSINNLKLDNFYELIDPYSLGAEPARLNFYCDSPSAQQALNNLDRGARYNINEIRINVHRSRKRGHVIHFVSIQ